MRARAAVQGWGGLQCGWDQTDRGVGGCRGLEKREVKSLGEITGPICAERATVG